MEWFYIVMAYLMVGLFVAVGLAAFDMEIENNDVSTVMMAWPLVLFYLLMLWIAEKRGPNDPCNH